MSKTDKELAFLRELAVESEWTRRFADFFDEKVKLGGEESLLYVNAGAGNHAIALREKLDDKTEINAVSESEELRQIAQAKADAVNADVQFAARFPAEKSDVVLADASFIRPDDLDGFLAQVVALSAGQVVVFLPTAGSFGEIFSFLWETLLEPDLIDKSGNVERLIEELPTVEAVEKLAEKSGLKKVESSTKIEIFEFKDGAEFISSPLVADFLLPAWLDFLSAKEKERVGESLVRLVDAEDGNLSFRFSVKNTLVSGEKAEKTKSPKKKGGKSNPRV